MASLSEVLWVAFFGIGIGANIKKEDIDGKTV